MTLVEGKVGDKFLLKDIDQKKIRHTVVKSRSL